MERNTAVAQYLLNLSATGKTDYSLWKATRSLEKPEKFNPPIKKPSGDWARTDAEKASTFAIHLAEVFKPNARVFSEGSEAEFLTCPQRAEQCNNNIQAATLKEFFTGILKLTIKRILQVWI
ncbi:unnamed protein product [Trichogramma brassicae]|uniref:Uncharacterized protein n=1 Tax=Trichogramma brassicae TaxID=86971 RepID=A0A6H5IM89_9HYME|nr:unnamed protein product [Trichogramma brassicae]